MEAGIEALARLLNLRDGYTGLHAERASSLAGAVGARLGLAGQEADALQSAARLHDIGKVGIPDRILHKPTRLDPSEWAVVRCHPGWGAEVLTGMPGMREVARIVRSHHERIDGRGYPDGLSGEDIPLASRIIGACEAFCSLTADRPFRPALSAEKALQVLEAGAGTHFDQRVVGAVLEVLEEQPALGILPADAPAAPVAAPEHADGEAVAPAGAGASVGVGAGLRNLGTALAETRLPALAESRERLLALCAEENPSPAAMADLAETDPGLAAALLSASARRGGGRASVREAVGSLGPEGVGEVAAEMPVYDFFQAVAGTRVPPERFRLHAVAVVRAARRVAAVIDHPAPGEVALAALLHDVGKIVLADTTPAYPAEVHAGARTPEQRVRAERRELTLDHASAGAMLLERWGVAGSVVEAVGGHHDDDRGRDAAVVRLADMLGHYATGEAVDGGALLAVARGLGLEGAELRAVMFDLHAPAPVAAGPGGSPEPAEPSPFTPRELDALRGLAAGGTYKEIADELGLSPSTLRSHLHNVYGKLGVADRAQAVLMAAERGWL
jgi:HD-GYP domain-containing protein (c-di-GMP phosphodiesterase class II)/DNA-binding CsgD family transcriptional regulator